MPLKRQKYTAKEEQKLMEHLWSPEIADDPYAFVMFAFPWGEKGTPLEDYSGPRSWQKEQLIAIRDHLKENKLRVKKGKDPELYRNAVASGRGIGKSALVAWLNCWHMTCRIGATAITTANSENQLKSRTWAEMSKWVALLINSHWFEISALRMVPAKWFGQLVRDQLKIDTTYYYADAQLWSEENPDAFAGVHNPRGVLLQFDESCHDDKTEVLTDHGWKLFKDLDGSEKMLTMNPETKQAEYLRPVKINAAHKKGKLHLYEKRGCNFCVTPNHEMFFMTQKGRHKDIWQKKQIQDLSKTDYYMTNTFKWEGEEVQHFQLLDRDVSMDYWLEFLGWYLSDGGLVRKDGIQIVQKDEAVIDRLSGIMIEFGFKPIKKYNANDCAVMLVYDRKLAEFMSAMGDNKQLRDVPRYVGSLSKRQIRIFLNSFMQADGYQKSDNCEVIYLSNKKMIDSLHELYLKLGMRSCVRPRNIKGQVKWIKDHWAHTKLEGYALSATKHESNIKLRNYDVKLVDYDGMVYCAQLPKHHLLLTRREGYCLWSGNSGIPQSIWDVSAGFFTDISLYHYFMAYSNPRRNTGAFFECFHKNRKYWRRTTVDSRTVEGINQSELQTIIDINGEDSYQARVEVKGMFPTQGEKQWISRDLAEQASKREVVKDEHAALIMGIDVARFGSDHSVVYFRRGRDARSIPYKKFNGKDNMELANICAELITRYNPDGVCCDAGAGTGVIDRLREMGYKVHEVWFGSKSDSPEYRDKRMQMWADMKNWLRGGCIPQDQELMSDLCAPEFDFAPKSDALFLEAKEKIKKRGLASPDIADALAITFAVKFARSDKKVYSSRAPRMARDVDYKIF